MAFSILLFPPMGDKESDGPHGWRQSGPERILIGTALTDQSGLREGGGEVSFITSYNIVASRQPEREG